MPADQAKAAVTRLNALAARFFRYQLPGSWVPPYLRFRGFSPAIQDLWQAGYAPSGWNTLTHHLRTLGWADEVIEQAGLARRSRRGNLFDVFRDRAMFPVTAPDGTIAGFIGRASDYAPADVPKYLNSPRTCLYDKSAVLFGVWEAREALAAGARPVIVEGPLDAIAVTAAGRGRFAGVAPCGTALTRRHLAVLARAADLRSAGVLVAFDSDPAGQRAAVHAYHLLCPLTETVQEAGLQPGQDPASVVARDGHPALYDVLAHRTHPLADRVTDSELQRWAPWLRYAEGQVNALRATAPIIAAMPPAHVGRQVARVAIRLGMTHAVVTEAVTDALTQEHHVPSAAKREPPSSGIHPSRPI
ncbi:MAG: toprim domain-containing protein [Streptosporangiales bacterium]